MIDRNDDRMISLEMRVAHQEVMIDDLSATVASQWRRIDALIAELSLLRDRIADPGDRNSGNLEPPPPHY